MVDFQPGESVCLRPGEGTSYRMPEGRKFTVRNAGAGWFDIAEHEAGWYSGPYNPDCFRRWPDSPVRTVTRKEIVPGTYGIVRVNGDHSISFVSSRAPSELRAAASTLIEIADALESETPA